MLLILIRWVLFLIGRSTVYLTFTKEITSNGLQLFLHFWRLETGIWIAVKELRILKRQFAKAGWYMTSFSFKFIVNSVLCRCSEMRDVVDVFQRVFQGSNPQEGSELEWLTLFVYQRWSLSEFIKVGKGYVNQFQIILI